MTKELLNEIEKDYWNEKADPIDMTEVFDLATKALEQKSYKSDARRWKRRYLDLKQRIFKLEEQTRWIPVSERLPETDGVYIVTRRLFDKQVDTEPYYMVDACYFDGSNTWHNDNRINHERNYLTDITAWWMSPPQPYKESEEAK